MICRSSGTLRWILFLLNIFGFMLCACAHLELHVNVFTSMVAVSGRISRLLPPPVSRLWSCELSPPPCVLTSLIFSTPFIIWSLHSARTPVEPNVPYTQPGRALRHNNSMGKLQGQTGEWVSFCSLKLSRLFPEITSSSNCLSHLLLRLNYRLNHIGCTSDHRLEFIFLLLQEKEQHAHQLKVCVLSKTVFVSVLKHM